MSLGLLPQAAPCDVLTFGIFPTPNRSTSISCRIELRAGQVYVVEVRGTGMPPDHPFRWPVRRTEEMAMLQALQSLISGDVSGVDVAALATPRAPYIKIIWASEVNGVQVNGVYFQDGLQLPAVMSQVLNTVMPGSGCEAATG